MQILITKDGKTYAETTVGLKFITEPDGYNQMIGKCESKEWHLYKAQLTAQDDVHGARFEMHLTKEGSYEFDLISLIPQDAVAGVFRKDLFEALKNLHPAFLRFPGGCIVEGTSLLHRYEWKKTVGELKDRKIKPNLWATQGGNAIKAWETSDCHYMQSYGIGFYEYFVLCELLSSEKRKCKALPVLNIGVACQFRSYQTVPVDSEEFQEYVQDALDLIEFANGDVNTKWGVINTTHILFIGAGAFSVSAPSDLIPELQGRFPLRVELEALKKEDFKRILTEPKNALVKQYKALLATEGVELEFSDDAIDHMASIAEDVNSHQENIGARRLHTIMESVLEELSFEADMHDGEKITIDSSFVDRRLEGIVQNQNLERYIL